MVRSRQKSELSLIYVAVLPGSTISIEFQVRVIRFVPRNWVKVISRRKRVPWHSRVPYPRYATACIIEFTYAVYATPKFTRGNHFIAIAGTLRAIVYELNLSLHESKYFPIDIASVQLVILQNCDLQHID